MTDVLTKDSPKTKIKRDAVATKARILRAGLSEFGLKGFGGARIEGIVKKAGCNARMIYQYFGGKQGLYLACLDEVYSKIRQEEHNLELSDKEPVEAIGLLVEFTFDHMRNNPDFVRLAGIENTQKAKFLKKLPPVSSAAHGLIESIEQVLQRGVKVGVLKDGIDAFQLYVSILSLSYLHLSNRFTLSVTYDRELGDEAWLDERRRHVCELIVSFVNA